MDFPIQTGFRSRTNPSMLRENWFYGAANVLMCFLFASGSVQQNRLLNTRLRT